MGDNIISIVEASKCYKKKYALENINLNIKQGEVIGILGKNGSGKTTLNKLIAGFTTPTQGSINVYSEKLIEDKNLISFLSENIAIYPELNAIDNLKQIYLMDNKNPDLNEINKIINTINLDLSKKKSKNFSLGMKRRLQIAMSILINPKEIIILDEPTNGLDINGVMWLKDVIRIFKEQNKTIILTSHAISELEELLDSFIILGKGRIIDKGDMNDLRIVLDITFNKKDIDMVNDLLNNKTNYSLKNNQLSINVDNEFESINIINLFNSNDIIPKNFKISKESLVKKFINLPED